MRMLLCGQNDFDMARAHVEEVSTEQVLFGTVTDGNLGNCDKVLVFADIVRKAFVAKGVDFTRNHKIICPNFN